MAKTSAQPESDGVVVLRDPGFAALLAWLIPGLGHLYQRRTAKGVLFMVTILLTYFFGLFIGGGRVVYASWTPQEIRWPYLCQVGVGIPALPALVQLQLEKSGKEPFFSESRFMAPPGYGRHKDELHKLHHDLNRYFELGTVYTMIAGLLNMLVIYDAWAGPAYAGKHRKEDKDNAKSASDKSKAEATT